MTSKDYDRDIDILRTDDHEFNVSIDRGIEPGGINVYDSILIDKEGSSKQMQTLMLVGSTLYLDDCDLSRNYDDPQEGHLNSIQENQFCAYSFNWPYFAFGTKFNYILVYNAFNPKHIQRFQISKLCSRIINTFLTDTHDLYVAIETLNYQYEIYHINLDLDDPRVSHQPLFRYDFDEIDHAPLSEFQVRSSSKKEKINLNKALTFYMLHGDTLWTITEKLEKVDEHCYNLNFMDEGIIYYRKTTEIEVEGKQIQHSVIKMVETQYSGYLLHQVYADKDLKSEILNFGVDSTLKKIIILSGTKNQKNKRDKFFTLFDIETEKVVYSLQIKNREIIGRLKSNLYTFVGGHIYYGKKVIKIRYDLLDTMKGQ